MRNLLLVVACAALLYGADGRNVVDYRISARLDPSHHSVKGSETLTWRNLSPDTIRELQFHLYMNAFRDAKSTFLRETGRDETVRTRDWGGIDISRLAVQGGADLTRAIRYIHPDDSNVDDRTVIAVALPNAILPGGSITLQIEFETRLPKIISRSGYRGDFHMVGQWFPKIGVWESAGQRYATSGQWNCHQFHANSEFYADYGRFDVTITVPSEFVVGATGVLAATDTKARATSYRYVQADVHDFAWTAFPHYVRVVRTFDPAREVTQKELADTARLFGLSADEVRLRPVQVTLLMQPEHAWQAERHFRAVCAGLKHFGLWYGAYPYDTLTLVDPPYGADGAGGMEYPTLITAGTDYLLSADQLTPEEVTVHEFGHQFWYGLVGNNEFEEAWLDEGFNTYSTGKVLDRVYGPQRVPVRMLGLPLSALLDTPLFGQATIDRGTYLAAPKNDVLLRNAWQFDSRFSYALNAYNRPALVLRTLENELGPVTMARVMRTYHQRWRYRHPCSQDFFDAVKEVSGRDMRWFFEQFVLGSNTVDYSVASVHDQTVRIRRRGEVIYPVDLLVRFDDGKTERRHWDGQYRWKEFSFDHKAAIASAEIDPGHKVLLDTNFANNSYVARLQNRPLMKWSASLLFWAQQALIALAGLA